MGKNILLGALVLCGLVILTLSNTPNAGIDEYKKSNDRNTYRPFVVLELFTSQGCSSCPAADILLEKAKTDNPENVFALSYHVDYWNYIGWEDPFSNADYALKQRKYNIKLRNRSNYTPQVVVNGKEHFVGSDSKIMSATIGQFLNEHPINSLTLSNANVHGNKISFEYQVSGPINQRKIRVVLAIDKRITNVRRGENKNRTLENSNIVVGESSFELLNNAKGSGKLEIPDIVRRDEKLHLILLLENKNHDILGAAKKEIMY